MPSQPPEPPRGYRYLALITAVFVTCLITANIIAVKPVQLGGLLFPAAVIVFPISYIFGDVLTEVYGYARSRQVIWIAFGCNLLAVVAMAIGGWLPPALFWTGGQPAYEAILGAAPRVLAASFVAYLAGEFLNSFVLARLKIVTRGRWLWLRTISSTLAGELVDSAIFFVAAFAGVWPGDQVAAAIITVWLLKSAYEALATPLTYAAVAFLKRAEQQDYYDYDTDFNPLKLDLDMAEPGRVQGSGARG